LISLEKLNKLSVIKTQAKKETGVKPRANPSINTRANQSTKTRVKSGKENIF